MQVTPGLPNPSDSQASAPVIEKQPDTRKNASTGLENQEKAIEKICHENFEQVLPQTTKRGWMGSLWSGVNYVTLGTAGKAYGALVQGAASVLTMGAISQSEKEAMIAVSKEKMAKLNDFSYTNLYEWISKSLWSFIKPKLLSSVSENYQAIISNKENFISDLLQIVLAQGFANLAELIQEMRQDQATPSSLMHLVALFINKMNSTEIEEKGFSEALASIEAEFENERCRLALLAKSFLPQLRFQEQMLIKEYIQTTDLKRKEDIRLFFTTKFIENNNESIATHFFSSCESLRERHVEMKKLFVFIADKVFFKSLFPKGLKELALPPQLFLVLEKYGIEKMVIDLIADYLQDFYDPLVYDPFAQLKVDLNQKVGNGVDQMLLVSNAFALGLSKHYIEKDPKKVVDFIQSVIPEEEGSSQTASVIAECLQEILESDHPSFQSLGNFIKEIGQKIVLAGMSYAAEFLISKEEKISPNQLVKVLVDRLVTGLGSLNLEKEIPDRFWENLGTDLFIPGFLKTPILSFIKKKVQEWRPTFSKHQIDLKETKDHRELAIQKIQGYKGGKDLIASFEQLIDWMVEKVGMKVQLSLDSDTIEDLFQDYFPGIQMSPEFKNWFKNNVSALSNAGEEGSGSISLLKQGISTLCFMGIATAVEKSGNGDQFIADLLGNVQAAWIRANTAFETSYAQQMPTVLALEAQIEQKKRALHNLNQRVAQRKEANKNYLLHTRLTGKILGQQENIKNAIRAQKRYHQALNNVEDLKESLEDLKQQLDQERQKASLIDKKKEAELTAAIKSTRGSLKLAEKELETSQKKQDLEFKKVFQEGALESGQPGYEEWQQLMGEVFSHLTDLDEVNQLTRSIDQLEKELEGYLSPFQALAQQFMGFIGLSQPDHLKLPSFLKNQIWPYLESFQKHGFARMLFKYRAQPFLKIDRLKAELEAVSGSSSLTLLAKTISRDPIQLLMELLPGYFNSYHSIAEQLFTTLSGGIKPTEGQTKLLAQEIVKLVDFSNENSGTVDQKGFTNKDLVRLYAKVSQQTLTTEEEKRQIKQLKSCTIKKELKTILLSPEKMIEELSAYLSTHHLPALKEGVKDILLLELQKVVDKRSTRYPQVIASLASYFEGVLLDLFLDLAKKHPAQKAQRSDQKDKETLVVIAEKLRTDPDQVIQSLPDFLKKPVINAVEKGLKGNWQNLLESLGTLKKVKKDDVPTVLTEEETLAKEVGGDSREILSQDLADFLINLVLNQLQKKTSQGRFSIIEKMTDTMKERLDLMKGQRELSQVLQQCQENPELEKQVEKVVEPVINQAVQNKAKLSEGFSVLLEQLLNRIIGKVSRFEKDHQAPFNQKLMTHLFSAAADYFKVIRTAREEVKKSGRSAIDHQDFKAAKPYTNTLKAIQFAFAPIYSFSEDLLNEIREKLIQSIQQEESGGERLTFEKITKIVGECYCHFHHTRIFDIDAEQDKALKALNADGLTLLEVIKQESLPDLRQTSAYTHAAKRVLSLLLPNGKEDLDFIPQTQRAFVYELLETTLFPFILQILIDLFLDPNKINQLLLKSLNKLEARLKGPIDVSQQSSSPSNTALNQAVGGLLNELLPIIDLPPFLKQKLLHSKQQLGEALGSVLMGQLTNSFLQDLLKTILQSTVERDKQGDFLFKYDSAPAPKVTDKDINKATKNLLAESISYQIRSRWAEAQARFDQSIQKSLGQKGMAIKSVLDQVFDFLFFKIIGTVLYYLSYPVRLLVKELIYKMIDLDKNTETLLGILTKKPKDQPNADYVVYNEDLIVNLGRALEQALKEATSVRT